MYLLVILNRFFFAILKRLVGINFIYLVYIGYG